MHRRSCVPKFVLHSEKQTEKKNGRKPKQDQNMTKTRPKQEQNKTKTRPRQDLVYFNDN